MPVSERRERRHLADQAIRLLAPGIGIKNILGVRIKSGKRGNRGNQHAHRVSVVVKTINEFLDALVDERVMRDVVSPIRQLRFRGKLAVKNQVRGFDVCAFFRQLFDRIAAVTQNSLVAVNIGNLARARSRVGERRVVAHQSKIAVVDFDRPQIQRANRVIFYGKFELAARPVIGDGQCIALS